MPREPIPFAVADLSLFARSLRRAFAARETSPLPSHVEMLNLLARAAGHRNLQALQASRRVPVAPLAVEDRTPLAPLSEHAKKVLRQFDSRGRLRQWPSKFSVQRLAMWILWMRFDMRRVYAEKEVNAVLKEANAFGDHVTLRRELVNHRLMVRTDDCREYRKLAARPDAEARALLAAWRARQRKGSAEATRAVGP